MILRFKIKFLYFVFCVWLIFVGSPLWGATVSGKVVQNGRPVEGAYIQILNPKGQELDAWTDSMGLYQIEEVWKGKWVVRISSSSVGAVKQLHIDVVQDDEEIVLPEQILEEIVSKNPESVKSIFSKEFHEYNEEGVSFLPLKRREIPREVSVFTKKHIFDAGIGNLDDLYMSTPGLYPIVVGGSSFSMRGIWGKENILVNGISLGSAPLVSDLFLQPDFLDRVEILTEPGSYFSSQSSRGGLINVVLRDLSTTTKPLVGVSITSDWENYIKNLSVSIAVPMYKDKNWVIGSSAKMAYGRKSFGNPQNSSSAVLINPSFGATSKRVNIKSDLIYGIVRGVDDPGVSSIITKSSNKEKIGLFRPVSKENYLQGELLLGLVDVGIRIVERDKGYLAYRMSLNLLHRFSLEDFSVSKYKLGDFTSNVGFSLGKLDKNQPKKGFDFESQFKLFVDTPFLKNDFLVSTTVGFLRKSHHNRGILTNPYKIFMKDGTLTKEDLIFSLEKGASFPVVSRDSDLEPYLVGSFTKRQDFLNEDQVLWGIRFFNQVAIWNLRLFVGARYDLSVPVATEVPRLGGERIISHKVVPETGLVFDLLNHLFGFQHLSAYLDCSLGFEVEDRKKTAFVNGGLRGKFINGYTFSTSVYKTWDERDGANYLSPRYDNLFHWKEFKIEPFEYWGFEGQLKGRVIPGLFIGGWYNFCISSVASSLTEKFSGYIPRYSGRFWVLTELPVTVAKGIFARASVYGVSSREYTDGKNTTIFDPSLKVDGAIGYSKNSFSVQLEFLNILNKTIWKISEDVTTAHPGLEGFLIRGAISISL